MRMTPPVQRTLDYLKDPHTIEETATHCREAYSTIKRRCTMLTNLGILDRVPIIGARGNGEPRIKYVVGTGERKPRDRTAEEEAALAARREAYLSAQEKRSKEPKHGGRVVLLTDHHRWDYSGQIQGYGPRFAAAILGE